MANHPGIYAGTLFLTLKNVCIKCIHFSLQACFLSLADTTSKPELGEKSPYTIMRIFLLMIRMKEATG